MILLDVAVGSTQIVLMQTPHSICVDYEPFLERSFDGQVLCMSGAYRNENQSCLLGMSRPSQEIWLLRCYRRYKSVFRIYFGVSQPSGKAFKG